MALRFFEPMTAPRPFLPTALRSLTMQEILARCSPAGPMQQTLMFWSASSSFIIC